MPRIRRVLLSSATIPSVAVATHNFVGYYVLVLVIQFLNEMAKKNRYFYLIPLKSASKFDHPCFEAIGSPPMSSKSSLSLGQWRIIGFEPMTTGSIRPALSHWVICVNTWLDSNQWSFRSGAYKTAPFDLSGTRVNRHLPGKYFIAGNWTRICWVKTSYPDH